MIEPGEELNENELESAAGGHAFVGGLTAQIAREEVNNMAEGICDNFESKKDVVISQMKKFL